MNVQGMTNKDLVDAIENGAEIESLKNSEGWKLIEEACQRVAESAQRELLTIKADDTIRIIEMQQVVKLYGGIIKTLADNFSSIAEIAFDEAKDRELIKKK